MRGHVTRSLTGIWGRIARAFSLPEARPIRKPQLGRRPPMQNYRSSLSREGIQAWFRGKGPVLVFLALLVLGSLFVVRPELCAERFPLGTEEIPERLEWVKAVLPRGIGIVAVLFAIWGLVRCGLQRSALRASDVVWLSLGIYVALSLVVWDWHIDDAAITYAYSQNLALGNGLVLHPDLKPEEAYSNTLWMLILALAGFLGADIPLAAKVLGISIGCLNVWLTFRLVDRLSRDQPGMAVGLSVLAVLIAAPFLIWALSGLEHGLQSLLMLLIVRGTLSSGARSGYRSAAAAAALLVLVRPEAPLVLIGWAVGLLSVACYQRDLRRAVVRLIPAMIASVSVLAALLLFRALYFGDLMPNPFYAKAGDANFLRLINIFGGGWSYLLSGLRESGLAWYLPFLCFAPFKRAPVACAAMFGVCLGHVSFVLYSGGDWMGMWRFLSPVVPLLAVLVGVGVDAISGLLGSHRAVLASAVLGLAFVGVTSATLLFSFMSQPSTSMRVVAAIAEEFNDLSRRLGVREPLLAHHDAGGSSFEGRIKLLDLGGLGSRVVAKNMSDHAFMVRYIVEEQQPAFVFGSAVTFAAGLSRFHKSDAFRSAYVHLEFVGRRHMEADLCFIRRDLVRRVSGLQLIEEGGVLQKVVVDPD